MRASALVVVCLVAAAAVALAAPVAASSVSAIREMEKAHVANLMEKYATAEWRADFTALVETASTATADPAPTASTGGADVGMCEVCTYVVENKAQHQPYLCRGLKDPQYQRHCVDVMESLMWWLTNEVYWLNYGCQRTKNSAVEWVRPCPAHALCSWIEHLSTRETFCPPDPFYPKPQ